MVHFVIVCSVIGFIEMSVCYHVKFWALQSCLLSLCHLPVGEGEQYSVHRTHNTKKSEVLPIGTKAASNHSCFVFHLFLLFIFLSSTSYLLM